MFQSDHLLKFLYMIVILALANWPWWTYSDKTTRQMPYNANLGCIKTADNFQLLNNFMNKVFQIKAYHFTERGRLRPAIETYMAAFLMHFEPFRAAHGDKHMIVALFIRVAKDLKITIATIEAWGSAIKEVVKRHDFKLPGNNIDNLLLIDVSKTSAIETKRDNLILNQEISSLKTIISETNNRCARIAF